MANFKVNGEDKTLDIEPDMPLLWALRDELGMTGTKFGCGVAACGACTVHINGVAVRSCVTPVSSIEGQEITTIEGLASAAAGSNPSDPALTAVQQAWVDHQVPQCGYCQSGQIMQAANLLERNNDPSEDDIVAHMNGHLCRCMAYPRIKRAIRIAAQRQGGRDA